MPEPYTTTPRRQSAGLAATLALGVALAGMGSAVFLSFTALRSVLAPRDCPELAAAECAMASQLARDLARSQLLIGVALVMISLPIGYWAYRRGARKPPATLKP